MLKSWGWGDGGGGGGGVVAHKILETAHSPESKFLFCQAQGPLSSPGQPL